MQTDHNHVLPTEACRKPDATAAVENCQHHRVAFEPVRWPDGFCLSVRVSFDWALSGWKDLARVCKSRAAGGNQRHRQAVGYASHTHFGQSGQNDGRRIPSPAFVLAVCGILLMSLSGLVEAGKPQSETNNYLDYLKYQGLDPELKDRFSHGFALGTLEGLIEKELNPSSKPALVKAQSSNNTLHGAYQNDNSTYTTEPGEPLPDGMDKTAWRLYIPTRDERIVFNTFGSNRFGNELDTVLAVYSVEKSKRAKGFQLLKAVADNDNLEVPGHYSNNSLVQFDAVKGKLYAIQVGSKGQGGDVLLTAFSFPPEGGLTIQPFSVYDGYNYA